MGERRIRVAYSSFLMRLGEGNDMKPSLHEPSSSSQDLLPEKAHTTSMKTKEGKTKQQKRERKRERERVGRQDTLVIILILAALLFSAGARDN